MSTHDNHNLASLPPATLRAALEASEKRVRGEKEKIQTEIRKLKKRFRELEEGEDENSQEIGLREIAETSAAGGSNAKRPRADSWGDNSELAFAAGLEERYTHQSITSAPRVDPAPILLPRCVCGVCR